MLADPQTLTVNAVPFTLLRTGSGQDTGTFRTADGMYTLNVSHAYGKRVRRTARLDYKVLSPDVMDSSINSPYSASYIWIADVPTVGISRTTQGQHSAALRDLLTAGGSTFLNKFLDGES